MQKFTKSTKMRYFRDNRNFSATYCKLPVSQVKAENVCSTGRTREPRYFCIIVHEYTNDFPAFVFVHKVKPGFRLSKMIISKTLFMKPWSLNVENYLFSKY